MSRTKPYLQQHLLTRSDLAQMGVQAAAILRWLAGGSIEQIGALAGEHGDDPVFTVAPALRAEMGTRLAALGKHTVVLSPLGVRSFLMRSLLRAQQRSHQERTHPERRQHHRVLAECREPRAHLRAQRRRHREHRVVAVFTRQCADLLDRTAGEPAQNCRRLDPHLGKVRARQQMLLQVWLGSTHGSGSRPRSSASVLFRPAALRR